MKHALNLPRHHDVTVDKSVMSQGQSQGWEEAVWFGLTTVPHRAWGCTVLLKCGALYRGLPLSAICHDGVGQSFPWELRDAQRWDCFGYDAASIEYDYLRELDCSVWLASRQQWLPGSYMFTCEPYGDGYSLEPSQTKSHHFIALNCGRITCVPGNNILWEEVSFTKATPQKPSWLRVQTKTHHAEEQPFDSVVNEESA